MINCESPKMCKLCIFMLMAISKPVMRASYSALLLFVRGSDSVNEWRKMPLLEWQISVILLTLSLACWNWLPGVWRMLHRTTSPWMMYHLPRGIHHQEILYWGWFIWDGVSCQEICEGLTLYCFHWHICDIKLQEDYCPKGYPPREYNPRHEVLQWLTLDIRLILWDNK